MTPVRSYVLPDGMTIEKLRAIAEWMDTLDLLLDSIKINDDPGWRERLESARGPIPRNEIQRDLITWANAIAAAKGK